MKGLLQFARSTFLGMCLFFSVALVPADATEKLAFVRGGNIWIANTDGTGEKQLTSSREDGGPALSPDGSLVAYHSGHDERTGFGRIFLVPSTGGTARIAAFAGMTGSEHPYFHPDGKRILFVGLSNPRTKGKGDAAMTYATMSVAIGDLETAAARPIVQTKDVMLDAGYVYSAPSVSPDGRLFAYQASGSDVSGGFVLFDENGKTVLQYPARTADPTPFWRPALTADGKQVLCYSPATSEKKKDAIYLVDRASGKRRLIAEGTHATFVDGGSAIVFEQWADKWGEKAHSDLWRLELAPGAKARKIVTNATQPAGQTVSVKSQ